MPQALVGLGSNLGDRHRLLDLAVQQLGATPGVRAMRASAWRSYAAIGGPADQPEYLNGAAVLETTLSPEELLTRLQEVEASLGRVRDGHWTPRNIDLDLLLYDEVVRQAPTLQLPHPRMSFRRFVLEGAAEVASKMRHPLIGWTITELLQHLRTALPYVAISGSTFVASQRLAANVALKAGWRLIESPGANDATQPGISPSLTLSQAIEFLHDQAELLAREGWPAAQGAVSSFWIEDMLAIGEAHWPGQLDTIWQSLATTVVPPKLLVLYETGDNVQPQYAAARASRPGVGPVLRLRGVDPATAEAEVIAAIQSMS